jgi:hypothetical protein
VGEVVDDEAEPVQLAGDRHVGEEAPASVCVSRWPGGCGVRGVCHGQACEGSGVAAWPRAGNAIHNA